MSCHVTSNLTRAVTHVRRYAAQGTCGALISGSRQIHIEGSGSQTTILDCMGQSRHFSVVGGATLSLSKIQLVNGRAQGQEGGSIYASGKSKVILENVVLSDAEAALGGAVYATEGTEVSITGNTVIKDSRADDGGCVYIAGNSAIYISGNGELRNCRAMQDSGGVHAVSSGVQFSDFAKATGCRATANGGVVSLVGDSGALTVGGQVQFTGNAAGGCTCALCMRLCMFVVRWLLEGKCSLLSKM